eukprot:m.198742 g.198742  ORF g.198742 m.198742 type:complete len:258 (+) comp10654_c0_seq11:336-1109(+)
MWLCNASSMQTGLLIVALAAALVVAQTNDGDGPECGVCEVTECLQAASCINGHCVTEPMAEDTPCTGGSCVSGECILRVTKSAVFVQGGHLVIHGLADIVADSTSQQKPISFSELESNIAALQSRAATSEGRIASIQGTIDDAATARNALAARIGALETDTTLQTAIDDDVKPRLQAVEELAASTQTSLGTKTSTLQSNLDSEVERLEGLIEALTTTSTGHNASVTDVQAAIVVIESPHRSRPGRGPRSARGACGRH